MKVVDKNTQNGSLVSLTFLVDSDYEKRAYRTLPGLQKCPHCGKPVNPADSDLMVIVPNPLEPAIPGSSLDLGMAITKCSTCGKEIRDMDDQCDLTSFPEVREYVMALRTVYQVKRAAAAQKGGTTGG